MSQPRHEIPVALGPHGSGLYTTGTYSDRERWAPLTRATPFELLREAVRQHWLAADQPRIAEIADRTGMSTEQVHTVLRSRVVAPWADTERVLRSMGIRDTATLKEVRELHEQAAVAERSTARRLLAHHVVDELASDSDRLKQDPQREVEIRRLTLLLEETRPPEVDLSGIRTHKQFLEQLRELKAAAGNISLRDLALNMRQVDPRHAIGKTTIGKYFAPNATMLPRTQTPGQVGLLLHVLLHAAAPPGTRVSTRRLQEYVQCWQRLMRTASAPAEEPVAANADEVPAVPELSLAVDHEAELRELGGPPAWTNFSLLVKAIAFGLLVCTAFAILMVQLNIFNH